MTPEEQRVLHATDPQAYQMRVLAQLAAAPGPPPGRTPTASFWFDPATGRSSARRADGFHRPRHALPAEPPVKAEADAGDANLLLALSIRPADMASRKSSPP